MLLKISQQTDLAYSDLISESIMELRMAPRQEEDQHRLSFGLSIGPPATVTSYFDWLGNTVHAFTVSGFHRQIQILATSVVETNRLDINPGQWADRWPLAPETYDYRMYDFLRFDGPVVDTPLLHRLAQRVKARPAMPLGELGARILQLLNEQFQYQQGVTDVASPITEMLEHGRGVCQDFAHLMVGLGRALHIPSRYVSGLLHPLAERFRGFTQTHAWCEFWFPSAGWIGFDPANNCIIGENFIKVAVGRDYRDVPPSKGVWRGSATETISVAVRSEELTAIPSELAAEQVQALPVPLFPDGVRPDPVTAVQQPGHQQQ